ncbi:MAG: CHAT domain-containing protein [Saprospiraceae bacterium]|nr:CHAT domain-containing protein [Saprospiraceae bacterium]
MHPFSRTKILLALLLLSTSLSKAQNGGDSFFDSTLAQMNQFLALDTPERIIDKFGGLDSSQAFNTLSCYQQGILIHKLGVSHYLLDQEYQAIPYFMDVVHSLWKSCLEVPTYELANSLYNIGVCYQYTPEKPLAKRYFNQSIRLLEKDSTAPKIALAEKYHGTGIYFEEISDLATAEIYLLNALRLYRQIPGTVIDQFDLLNRLLILGLDFQNHDAVIKYFEEALALHAKFPDKIRSMDLAAVNLNAATSYLETSNFNMAKQLAAHSLTLIDSRTHADLYSNALETLGMIYKRKGALDSASAFYHKVIDLRLAANGEIKHSYQSKSIAFENLSELQLLSGDYTQALKSINSSVRTLCPGLNFEENANPIISLQHLSDPAELVRKLAIKAKILYQQSLALSDKDLLQKSLLTMQKLDTVVGAGIVHFSSDLSQLELLHIIASHYSLAMEICLELFRQTQEKSFLAQAYFFSSRSKAVILQKHLIESQALDSLLTPPEIAKKEAILARIADINNLLQYDHSVADSLLQISLSAQLDLEVFHEYLDTKYPGFMQLKRTYLRVPSILEIQQFLPTDQCLIDFFYGNDFIITFCLTNETFFHTKTNINDHFEKGLNEVIASQYNPQQPFPFQESTKLYNQLLAPTIDQLPQRIKRICILPHGKLHSLSMDAICFQYESDNSNYLISKYAISYAFSTGLFMQAQYQKKNLSFLGYGTNYSQGLNDRLRNGSVIREGSVLASLDMAETEVNDAAALFRGKKQIGDEATLDDFLQHAGTADIIYLSLHGLVDYDHPNKSCIIFDDRGERYILSPQILRNQNLHADLVLMSSCHSASGKIYQGEGVSGMTRAFLYAGARNVLSSLWSATEISATKTLASFLTLVKAGLTKDAALQIAKLDYLQQAPPSQLHPYYWANFVLVGSSVGDAESTGSHYAYLSLFIILMIIILIRIKKQ